MRRRFLQTIDWMRVLFLVVISTSGPPFAGAVANAETARDDSTDEPIAETVLTPFAGSEEHLHPDGGVDAFERRTPDVSVWSRLWPSLSARSDGEFMRGGFGVWETEVAARMGTYPVFGPPPPFITPGFALTVFEAPDSVEIPQELYTLSTEFSWLRPINDQWAVRLSLTPTFASDMRNTSSDAWRFRGMALAFYDWSPEWKVGFGVVATGRDDLPLIPGIGAVWTPTSETKADLFFPRPRLSHRVLSNERRQAWAYLGGELGGGTWAFERRDGIDDVLTYRSWRLLLGMEWTPPEKETAPWSRAGLRGFIEVGYVFGRRVEYEGGLAPFHPSDSGLVSAGLSF